jgi:hypothetical protein
MWKFIKSTVLVAVVVVVGLFLAVIFHKDHGGGGH